MPANFKRANGLLKRLFVVFADAHGLTDCAHLCAKLVFDTSEFFEGPACKLYNHIVTGRGIFFKCTIAPVGNLIHSQAAGKHRGDQGDGKAGRFGSKRRRARGSRIDFNDDDAVGFGVVSKLNVGSADDADGFDNIIGIFLEALLKLRRNGQHWSGAI